MPAGKIFQYRKKNPRKWLAKRRRVGIRPRTMTLTRRVSPYNSHTVHSFRRKTSLLGMTGNAVYNPYLQAWTFKLSDLNGLTDFTGLFDHYRITYVVLKFYLSKDPGAETAVNAVYPRMFWAIDNDDATLPANLNELREHGDCKTAILSQHRPVVIKLKPSTLNLGYVSAVANTYVPKWGQWVDMNTTGVPYYGLKWAIDNFTVTSQFLNVEATYYFQCKGVR